MNPPGTEADAEVRSIAVRPARKVAQVWIETLSDDPEAVSAFAVAQRSPGGAMLRSLRRARVIEIEGALPPAAELAERLHDSTRFYNPNKERSHLRLNETDPAPVAAGERAVLVFDRGGERREGAERWWKRATGSAARVREGTAWILGAASAAELDVLTGQLFEAGDSGHGLLCNPHAEEYRRAEAQVPLAWFASVAKARKGKR